MKRAHSTSAAIIAFCFSVLLFAQSTHAAVTYYGGGWNVNGFGGPVSGNAFAQFMENGTQVQLNLDVQGPSYFGVFGTVSPSVLELVGTRNADQSITFNPVSGHPTYGNVSAAVNSTGAISMQWLGMPLNEIITASGPVTSVISPANLELDFALVAQATIALKFPGSIDMRSVPEPTLLCPFAVALALACRRRFRARDTA